MRIRATAYPGMKFAWLGYSLHVPSVKRQVIRMQLKPDCYCFSGLDVNPPETLEFFYRSRHVPNEITDVALYHLLGGNITRIAQVRNYFQRISEVNFFPAGTNMPVVESCIGQAVSKGE